MSLLKPGGSGLLVTCVEGWQNGGGIEACETSPSPTKEAVCDGPSARVPADLQLLSGSETFLQLHSFWSCLQLRSER